MNIKEAKELDHVYASCDYTFYHKILNHDKMYFAGKKERTIYCDYGSFFIGGIELNPKDSIEIKNRSFEIEGKGKIFVAEVSSRDNGDYIKITESGNHYKVSKPWGYELWINGDHPLYSFKIIQVNQGTRTSLQYHRFKEETTLINSGVATLVYKTNKNIDNDDVTLNDLSEVTMKTNSYIHLSPNTLHRTIAATDITMIEISTPFLNDVIRVMDDANRTHGRIEEEHK